MKMTFRWFGEGCDSVALNEIKQIPGCSGLMGVIDSYPAGAVWEENVIKAYVDTVHRAGLEVEVIESVNVHEDIKMGLPSREQYIENYITTIKNLSKYGIKVIVYNFMPVFDWLRTNLALKIEDGSSVLYYNEEDIRHLTPLEIVAATGKQNNGYSLPGWEPERLQKLKATLDIYKSIDKDQLRDNYKYFLERIIPICEQTGIKMAVHPDDPAWEVFGIPRLAHSMEDFDAIVKMVDSPSNGICLCTGSLGSDPDNDIPHIIEHFCRMDRIPCAHVRNIKHYGYRHFRECSHLSSEGSLDMYVIVKAFADNGFDGYIRPDHGRMIWGENARPGYGLYDRALGLTYLNGLWEAITKGRE